MAALLTSDQNNIDRVTIEINECRKMGLTVAQPDINESFPTFGVINDGQDNKIRFGLNAIKNVGHHIAENIWEERKAKGNFKSLEDFLNRIKDKDLNRKSLESMIRAGALDCFLTRGKALGNLETLLEYNKKLQNEAKSGQSNLFFGLPLSSPVFSLKLEEYSDVPIEKKLSWEKELLGLYLSNHPFKEYLALLKDQVTPLKKIKSHTGETIQVAGIITNIQKITTQGGKAMLFVTLEDSTDSTELLVFPKTLSANPALWQDENLLIVSGKVSDKDGQAKILVENGRILEKEKLETLKAKNFAQNKVWLNLPIGFDKDKMQNLKDILQKYPGQTPVYLIINNGHSRKLKTDIKILPATDVRTEIENFLGQNTWTLEI